MIRTLLIGTAVLALAAIVTARPKPKPDDRKAEEIRGRKELHRMRAMSDAEFRGASH